MAFYTRIYTFIICLLTLSVSCWGQSTTVDSLLMLSENPIPTDSVAIDQISKMIYKHYRTYPELTEKIAYKIQSRCNQLGLKRREATAWRRIGASNYVMGRSSELVKSQHEALKIYQEIAYSEGEAYCHNNLGLAYLQINEWSKALDHFQQALGKSNVNNESFKAICYNNIALVYYKMNRVDSALAYNQRALAIRLDLNERRRLQATYTNLGTIYSEQFNDHNKAMEYLSKAIAINVDIGNYTDLATNYVYVGNISRDKKEFEKARQHYRKAIQYADSSKDVTTKSEAYLQLSELEQSAGRPDFSILHYKNYHESILEALESQKKVEVNRLENNYVIKQKEKELIELEKEKAEQKTVQVLLILGSIGILLIAAMIIIVLRWRVKSARLKARELTIDLEQKNKELTSYALNFIQKNELISEISEKIQHLKNQSDGSRMNDLLQMERILQESFRIDQGWNNFKRMFEEVHKDFFVRLKENYPDLGSSELKLCALIRLNLNLKEAAGILGISPDSVKTARYRLRKKLDLIHDENLADFLMAFDKKEPST
ncbi:MAG: tetratricopeptide repeat protein [Reichenbachiella sp.]|uniref:tetratricopeptide repeat protein n=1 Tax=Reichenbachiella sp. TaxID=2184521 RepID=UPI003263BFB6